ncbi:hypothetical protein V1478_015773, partial [Vespula squamosa]
MHEHGLDCWWQDLMSNQSFDRNYDNSISVWCLVGWHLNKNDSRLFGTKYGSSNNYLLYLSQLEAKHENL